MNLADEHKLNDRFRDCLEVWLVIVNADQASVCFGFADRDVPGEPPFLTDEEGLVVVAREPACLRQFLGDVDFSGSVNADAFTVDIDKVRTVPKGPLNAEMATMLWNAWSILDDLARTIGTPLRFNGRDRSALLDKIFAAMRMDAITLDSYPPYTPTLTRAERRKYYQMIERGVRVLHSAPLRWVG